MKTAGKTIFRSVAVVVAGTFVLSAQTVLASPIGDGAINVGEYSYAVSGQGGSFNGAFGSGATLSLDSSATSLFIGLELGGLILNGDVGVIYLDTTTGGLTSTTQLSGNGNENENVIAGDNGGNVSELTFGSGFTPDFALTFQDTTVDGADAVFVGLYSIDPTATPPAGFSLPIAGFVDGVNLFNTETTGDVNTFELGLVTSISQSVDLLTHEIEISLASLGLTVGDTLGFVGTLSSPGLYRSNEFFGLSAGTVAAINNDGFSNVANNPFTIPDGENGAYTIVPEPTSLVLASMGAMCIAARRRK